MANLCPKCARLLDADSYCNRCDISVSVYKKIKDSSMVLYNQGLQKAKVRDLSASIDLLNRSVRLNKNNSDARNLLGLIYFEIGETVSALQQWVVSKNLRPQDNEAIYYLNQVQNNQSYLDKLNTAIKKYNQSLIYIEQGSVDLAIIQLKKVTSLNPKYVKAFSLLALCYLKDGHIEKAHKVLFKILAIDKSNYIARKYLDILQQDTVKSMDFEDEIKAERPKGIGPRPVKTKANGAFFQFISMAVGVAIGLAIMNFMVLPGRIDNMNSEINILTAQLVDADSQIDTLEATVSTLEMDLEEISTSDETMSRDLKEKETQLSETIKVLSAMNLFVNADKIDAAENLFLVEKEALSAEVSVIYDSLTSAVYPSIAEKAHNDGYTAYMSNRFEEAIGLLTTSYKYAKNAEYSSRTLYFLARSYYKSGDIATSIPIFQKVIDDYPTSRYVTDAQYFITLNSD